MLHQGLKSKNLNVSFLSYPKYYIKELETPDKHKYTDCRNGAQKATGSNVPRDLETLVALRGPGTIRKP